MGNREIEVIPFPIKYRKVKTWRFSRNRHLKVISTHLFINLDEWKESFGFLFCGSLQTFGLRDRYAPLSKKGRSVSLLLTKPT